MTTLAALYLSAGLGVLATLLVNAGGFGVVRERAGAPLPAAGACALVALFWPLVCVASVRRRLR